MTEPESYEIVYGRIDELELNHLIDSDDIEDLVDFVHDYGEIDGKLDDKIDHLAREASRRMKDNP